MTYGRNGKRRRKRRSGRNPRGVVQVFELHEHPTAKRCYAWSHETDEGKRRFVAVLHQWPVASPVAAVRAAIVRENREKQGDV